MKVVIDGRLPAFKSKDGEMLNVYFFTTKFKDNINRNNSVLTSEVHNINDEIEVRKSKKTDKWFIPNFNNNEHN